MVSAICTLMNQQGFDLVRVVCRTSCCSLYIIDIASPPPVALRSTTRLSRHRYWWTGRGICTAADSSNKEIQMWPVSSIWFQVINLNFPRRVHFWLVHTFKLNPPWVQQKQMCHLDLGNVKNFQERHITKCRDSGAQG
ncbi:hypothetical protein J6590_034633 [Homalodisca vitripennis]|nr:hypothetical protein J6590_034633 [Homalodisca vitripennis]